MAGAAAPSAGARGAPAPGARIIEPRAPGVLERVREFWAYRHLIWFFGKRSLEKRYLRTWIGWPWIPMRPLLDVGSRALLFGGLLGVPSKGVPYPIFFLVGMGAWQLFERTGFWAMRSLDLNKGVLRSVYVPRLTVLSGAIVPSGIEWLIYMAITAVVVAGYALAGDELYVVFGPETLLVVAGLLILLGIAFGIGAILSVYAAQARDVRFGYNYVIGFWMFLTPVIYPLDAIPYAFQVMAQFNPMTAPVEMIKAGLIDAGNVTPGALLASGVALLVFGIGGMKFFNVSENRALDSF